MAGKPRAVIVCPESPFPAVGGGPLRTNSILEYLAPRYDLELIVFDEKAGPPGATIVRLREHSRTTAARVLRNLSRAARGVPPLNDRFTGYSLPVRGEYELALFEHFWCAGYVNSVAAKKKWLNLHNVESEYYRSAATGLTAPLMRRFSRSARQLERELLPQFTGILVASEVDLERVKQISPKSRPFVLPNTIPLIPLPPVSKRREIVFSGNLEYEPNRQAVRYFRQSIWPRLRELDVRWRVIGKNPHAVSRMLGGDSHIEIVGPVEDAVAEIAAAQVSLVPLLAGSGTRVKIIEAWAAGTPVVSTSIGAEGLPGIPERHLLIRDSPETFAAAVRQILENQQIAASLATEARGLYERNLTWNAAAQRLSAVGL